MRRFYWACMAFSLLLASGCKTDAEEALARGNLLRNEGDLAGAIVAYQEATKMADTRAELQLHLGEALMDAHRVPEAKQALRLALELDGALVEARLALARLEAEGGNTEAAIALLGEVIEGDPRNLFALMSRGNLALTRGEAPSAVKDYARAVAIDDRNQSALYGYGSALLATGDRERARATMETLERLDPDAPFGAYGLARLAATSEKPERALPLLREALRRAALREIPLPAPEIRADPHFQSLLGHPDFLALFATKKATEKTTAEPGAADAAADGTEASP